MRHDDIWRAIDALAAEHGLSASGLARKAGLDPTAFNPSKRVGADGRARWPSTESVAKILTATGTSIEAFAALVTGMPALPRRTPGVNNQARGGRPVPQVGNQVDPQTALAALSALSGQQQPRPNGVPTGMRPQTPPPPPSPASDPRRWQRIDVTSEHLRGAPVPVPESYAAQLGMRPGTLLSVTGPGDNAVVLVWRDQPVFDSLQPVLMRLNARPGDSVYVTINGYRLDAQLTSAAN